MFADFLSEIIHGLDMPARSIYSTQLLDLLMQVRSLSSTSETSVMQLSCVSLRFWTVQQSETIKPSVLEQGTLVKLHKIVRYCVHTSPLTYGSAVLCRKAVNCLKTILISPPQVWLVQHPRMAEKREGGREAVAQGGSWKRSSHRRGDADTF